MINVMISYSHVDQQCANKIVSILEENQISCWIDYRDATPGINYAGSIVRAIKKSDFVVVILSGSSIQSSQVLNEINAAVNSEKNIIPFKIDNTMLNDSMEYYLGKTHWMEAISAPIEPHIYRLVDTIVNKKCNEDFSNSKSEYSFSQSPSLTVRKGCRMVKLRELLELGYTSKKIVTQLVENDYINFNGIGVENEGTPEQWEEMLQNNADTFQYMINEKNEIVGDWSMVALTDECYAEAECGQLHEADINENNTELICFPDFYNGYILTFAMLPQYRTAENFNLLFDSFVSQIEAFSEQEIFFKRWCINVFSKEVEALIKKMGFKYKCNNKTFGKIYCCDFIPLPDASLLKKYTKLLYNYENL